MHRLRPLYARQQIPLQRRIWLIRRSIISLCIGNHTKLNRRITLPIRTRGRSLRNIIRLWYIHFPRRDILACDGALEDRESREGLVEGHFVAGFVDADEAEFGGLLYLPMGDTVGGLDVDETGLGEVVVVDLLSDGLPSDPVAVVIGL
jgi:hypothetical protein